MNLGIVLSGCGKQEQALACFEHAQRIRPDDPPILDSMATAYARLGKLDEALALYDNALRLQPDYAEPRRNRAMVWLSRGDFERGWPEYEWRWRCQGKALASYRQPLWRGEDLAGRTILVHCEQGHGDTLQFIRYAALLKQRGGKVHVVCPPPLVRLLNRCWGVDRAFPPGTELPDFDVHIPLLSLPGLLGTTLATVPAEVPYLYAEEEATERWRERLKTAARLKVGIAWQGNPRYGMDRLRSFPLAKLAPLSELSGVRLISLQKGAGTEQLREIKSRFFVETLGDPGGDDLGDFLDTAAILKNLDLVLTPDMAYAHLAGGLGVRTWVVLPSVAEWRWLIDREDSPWYPSARLFRQPAPGDWDAVFQRVAEALRVELER